MHEPPHDARDEHDTDPDHEPAPEAAGQVERQDQGSGDSSQASRLVALAVGRYTIVQSPEGRAYGIERDGPNIAIPLRGRDGLRQRLARTFYEATGIAAGGSALTDALTVIEGMAAGTDPVPIGLRVADHPRGHVLDLGTTEGTTIALEAGRWHLRESSPVLFRRSALTGPLPVPVAPGTGSLAPLRGLLNVSEESFRIIVGWLVAALIPSIAHPILTLTGEQGTAKSTAARFLMGLFDPSAAPLRTAPKDVRDWATTANASWGIALDNLSSIAPWFSDTLCKAVTGDGIVGRALFTDDDVTVMSFRRVILITSIDAGALAGDLAERMVLVELDVIDRTRRRPEADVEAEYQAGAPAVLGAILDLTAAVLDQLPLVHLDELPRMADFARILAALDTVTGWATLDTYTTRAAETTSAVLDADPVASAVLTMIDGQAVGWAGTPAELHAMLTPEKPAPRWPKTPAGLTGHLRRVAPALRGTGVDVEFGKTNGDRYVRITRTSTPRPTT